MKKIVWQSAVFAALIITLALLPRIPATVFVDGKEQPATSILADTAALVATNTEARLVQLDEINVPGDIDDVITSQATILAEIVEVEKHIHNNERWLEAPVAAIGEVHAADEGGMGSGAFQIDAGDSSSTSTYGAWVQVIGSSDTPIQAGKTKYDLHRMEFTTTERSVTYWVQIAFGDSGTAALSAGDYTVVPFTPVSNQIDSGPVDILDMRRAVGTKAWVRCVCPGQNTATMNFFIGLHEYDE